jgi:tetratricopeptide (TPR) repeat protein
LSQGPEIISLLGIPHYARPATGEDLQRLERELDEAVAALEEDPQDVTRHIMHGRRLAYLWRYHKAIAVYSEALTSFGESASLYRHRGHRYISVRRFGPAVRDLRRAYALQPHDFDICYHLGLARWLLGDYAGAREAYQGFMPKCSDHEERVALSYWLYMSVRRLGMREEAARILEAAGSPDVDENKHYLDLLRLFRGEVNEADIHELMSESPLAAGTLGFGLGCWHLFEGRPEEAAECFVEVVGGKYWPAFGFIAAETELARLQEMLPA